MKLCIIGNNHPLTKGHDITIGLDDLAEDLSRHGSEFLETDVTLLGVGNIYL